MKERFRARVWGLGFRVQGLGCLGFRADVRSLKKRRHARLILEIRDFLGSPQVGEDLRQRHDDFEVPKPWLG